MADVEVVTPVQAKIAKSVASAQAHREARQLAAPGVGDATTIDQVLARGNVVGPVASAGRRAVLEYLIAVGGEVKHRRSAMSIVCTATGVTPGLLRSMWVDNQIGIEKPTETARQSRRVYLVDPLELKRKRSRKSEVERPELTELSGAEPRRGKPPTRYDIPLPRLGDRLRIVAMILDDDGTDDSMRLGLKGPTGNYMVRIEGYQAPESNGQ